MGRKSRYETHVEPYLDDIRKWYQLLNEGEIAKKLGIGVTSFEKYKREHPELREALREGRFELVEDLKLTLKKKAKGFSYTEKKRVIRDENGKKTTSVEETERYFPPDTGAIHLLLKNLDDNWRNDDGPTMALRREKLELDKKRAETNDWS